MSAGLTKLLALRFARPGNIFQTALSSPARKIGSLRTTDDNMFGRANQAYQAAHSVPKQPPGLGKQLFPSSSPSQADITQSFKKPRAATQDASQSRTSQALNPRSTNDTSRPTMTSMYSRKNSGLASLIDKRDSFSTDTAENSRSQSAATDIVLLDDDFSDDDALDLSYACPTALPEPVTPAPPRASAVSNVSWSQSSPSHYVQPQAQLQPQERRTSLKRSSSDESSPIAPAPAAKKRALPKHYHVKEVEVVEATPQMPSKSRDPAIWDASASAVKAQKKQLKNQLKKPVSVVTDMAEMQQAAMTSKSNRATHQLMQLSDEQEKVKNMVCQGKKSVFFTGPAGTGKSVLMRSIIADLKKKYAKDPERLAITASTGLAACNIGGQTLHSFAGIGLGKEDAAELVKKIRKNSKAKNRWLKTHTLIIDEISMVDGELFDKLSQIGRTIRNNGRPWGGIQLVITGDFFQLPPVAGGDQPSSKFAFDAATWGTTIDETIGLTQVFRQKDPTFANMLNEMRLGKMSANSIQAFQKLRRPLQFDDGLEVTELFPTKNEVERSNERRLQQLPGKTYHFECRETGDPQIRDRLLMNMMAPKAIDLKKGAQVMLIKNLDDGLVNGSLGTVIGFTTEDAFAISGGLDEDDLERSGNSLRVDPDDFKRRVAMFSKELSAASAREKPEYPLVQFHDTNGISRTLLCVPEVWKVELPTGEVQASREQLPLILAWALSIHKAQGQTLERVKVDMTKIFEKGQAYVALSRATSQEGLQVIGFNEKKVMAHQKVVQFYQNLYSVDSALKKRAAPSMSTFLKGPDVRAPAARGRVVIDLDADSEDEREAMAAYG